MSVLGIDEITYVTDDLNTCGRFFVDWGLRLVKQTTSALCFECLNGCRVNVASLETQGVPAGIEEGPTLREVVWGVEQIADLEKYAAALAEQPGFIDINVGGLRRIGCLDPNGLAVRLQVSRKLDPGIKGATFNTWNSRLRVNEPAPNYERATPVEVGHVVFFVADVASCEAFYTRSLGFVVSDRYPGRGAFLRCAPKSGHHDLFLLQLPSMKRGINHVAFTVRDIHEVFGGGLHFSRCGWETQLGPGRHPISSAYFWYFKNPAGGLVEYYSDEDELTSDWQPREFEPGPTVFAEWAVEGGLDGHTRRQKNAPKLEGKFLTET